MFAKTRTKKDALSLIWDLSKSYQKPAVLAAGVQLGVFGKLARKAMGSRTLARSLRCSEKGIDRLCHALRVMGFLDKKGTRFFLPRIWKHYLDPKSSDYVGMRFLNLSSNLEWWGGLADSVRRGKPKGEVGTRKAGKKVFRHVVPALYVANSGYADEAARLVGVPKKKKEYKVLDLAAGSGVWGFAAAKRNPRVEVSCADYPEMLTVAKQFAKRERISRRVRYLPGDLRKLVLPKNSFDLAILGLVCHQFSPADNKQVFRKVFSWLKPGGTILIPEFTPYEDLSGPPFAVFFALQMLLVTKQGDAFTRSEYAQWLTTAGFRRLRVEDLDSTMTLIWARKPAGS